MKAELLILGVLHRGDLHPYEMKRRLERAMVECYTDVDVGTLYYAVRQLARSGHIAPVRRQRVARGGMRTVYRITAKGRRRFQELLLERFAADGSVAETLYAPMLFLHLADAAKVAELLRVRVRRQTELLQELAAVRLQLASLLSTGGRHLLAHLEQQRRLDRKWLQRVRDDVVARRIEDVPELRRLAEAGERR